MQCDLTHDMQLLEVKTALTEKFGRLDILINSAGKRFAHQFNQIFRHDQLRMQSNDTASRIWCSYGYKLTSTIYTYIVFLGHAYRDEGMYNQHKFRQGVKTRTWLDCILHVQSGSRNANESISYGTCSGWCTSECSCAFFRRHKSIQISGNVRVRLWWP